MDVYDIKNARLALEKSLKVTLLNFEKTTGTSILDFRIHRIETVGNERAQITHIKIDVVI